MYSITLTDWATTTLMGVGIHLQRCSWCFLQHQLTGPPGHSWFFFLSLCIDAVGVVYRPNRLGHQVIQREGGSYPSAEMQSVYFTAPDDWTTRTLAGNLAPLLRCSRCILEPNQLTGLLLFGVAYVEL